MTKAADCNELAPCFWNFKYNKCASVISIADCHDLDNNEKLCKLFDALCKFDIVKKGCYDFVGFVELLKKREEQEKEKKSEEKKEGSSEEGEASHEFLRA